MAVIYAKNKTTGEWERVSPETAVIDPTLSIEGAPADAKATGDALEEIRNQIDNISDNISFDGLATEDYVDSKFNEVSGQVSTKQDALTFDATPTAGSTNPVTSEGIKAYVDDNKFVLPEGYPVDNKIVIEWDGDITGKVTVTMHEDGDNYIGFCKVSDLVLTDDEIKSGIATITSDGGTSDKPIANFWDEMVNDGCVTNDMVSSDALMFVRKDGATFENLVFPETGVYFMKMASSNAMQFVSGFITGTITTMSPTLLPPETMMQSDLSQTDDTAVDYVKGVIRKESLPEGFPYKGFITERFEIASHTITNGSAFGMLSCYGSQYSNTPLVLSFDGVEYNFTTSFGCNIEFGDTDLVDCPFYITGYFAGGAVGIDYTITCISGTHEIIIWQVYVEETMHKMASYFTPQNVPNIYNATVGQIARVAVIDSDGMPVYWEAVDMETGITSWNELEDKPFDANNIIKSEALPEGYPYKEKVESEVQLFQSPDNWVMEANGGSWPTDMTALGIPKEGDVCRVVFEGKEYTATAYLESTFEAPSGSYNNVIKLSGGENTGYSSTDTQFIFTFISAEKVIVELPGKGRYQEVGEVCVYGTGVTETIHPMAEEFLPYEYAQVSYVDEQLSTKLATKQNTLTVTDDGAGNVIIS